MNIVGLAATVHRARPGGGRRSSGAATMDANASRRSSHTPDFLVKLLLMVEEEDPQLISWSKGGSGRGGTADDGRLRSPDL